MAALMVFMIITLGIIPLLLSSIRAAALSRSFTVGKNVAIEGMERARDLPFRVAYASQNRKVDVLDAYFPRATGSGYAAGSGASPPAQGDYKYTTVCTPSSPADAACIPGLPAGYKMTFTAQFVKPTNTSPETYVPVAPVASYAWDSVANDGAASQLLRISVLAEWTQAGAPESFRLTSIVADRKFGIQRSLRGSASVDYGIQILTSYTISPSGTADLSVIGGNVGSGIESQESSSADQTVVSGEMRKLPSTTDPQRAATSVHHAAPDSTPTGISAAALTYTDAAATPGNRAFLNNTATSGLQVGVASQLPQAQGSFSYSQSGANTGYNSSVSSTTDQLWAHNKISTVAPVSNLRLDSTKKLLTVRPFNPGTGNVSLSGNTSAVATSGGVTTNAQVRLGRVLLMPTTSLVVTATTTPAPAAGVATERAVIAIDDFKANVTCTSTRNGATATVVTSWSATLWYWTDTTSNNTRDGSYKKTTLPVPGAGESTLAAIKTANPVVYDAATDIRLFGTTAYLKDWSSLAAATTSPITDGRETSAVLDGALRVQTNPTDTALPESGLTTALGNISCESVDRR